MDTAPLPILSLVLDELKRAPITMLLQVGLIIAVWRLYDLQPTYATVMAMNLVHREVIEMKLSVDKASLLSRLQSDATQLFAAKRFIDDLQKEGKKPDDIYYSRVNELTNDHDALMLELDGVQRSINILNAPMSDQGHQ